MYLRMVTRSLARRRSRVIVALLAVAIGATTLAGLVTVSVDIPRQMAREFRSYGANLVVLPANAAAMDPSVLDAAADLLPAGDVVGVAPYRYDTVRINEQPFLAAGTDLAGARAVSPYWYVTGEWPAAGGELLIGQDVAELIDLQIGDPTALTGTDAAGKDVTEDFAVAGILETGGAEDGFVFMAADDLGSLLGGGDRIDVVEYSIAASQDVLDSAAAEISENVSGASAATVKRVTESETSLLGTLSALLVLVTVVVLVLTMVTVSTTMIAVVTERRREIGLKKALGAENRGIVGEFLGEAALIGAVGGLAGSLLGFVFAQMVSINVFNRGISLQVPLIPLTVLVCVVVTTLACLIPVRRAVDVEPAIVLRGE
jgi:putative ABC transport system permease protein